MRGYLHTNACLINIASLRVSNGLQRFVTPYPDAMPDKLPVRQASALL